MAGVEPALADDGLPPLRDIVRAHGIEPVRSLGQNFLFDLNLTRKIARAAGPLAGVRVLEVGPGPGGLTRALLAEGARVLAVERDRRCLEALSAVSERYPGRLEVIAGDALEIVPARFARARGEAFRVVANLPYNIATALLTRWLETEPWPPWFDGLVLMFQREVAERIVATPASRAAYGRLGVLCGWRTRAAILFDVPPSAFVPPPKVVSSVVRLIPRDDPLPCRVHDLVAVAAAAFGQRRKTLRQALRSLAIRHAGLDVAAMIAAAGLDGGSRAEALDVPAFAALARAYREQVG